MGKRISEFSDGEFYHLYNRGNSKQDIFLDDEDRNRFVKLLYLCNSKKSFDFREDIVSKKINAFEFDRGESIVSIGAWVLMPNHFHLLITIPTSRTPGVRGIQNKENNISFFMRRLCMSYSKYFNKKYERSGGLFESSFKNKRLDTDEYLKYIFSYIHLNPIKIIDPKWKDNGVKNLSKSIKYLDQYNWSSYGDYTKLNRVQKLILSKKDFPDYFNSSKVFNEEISDWLNFNE